MSVFISWSGNLSQKIAAEFKTWIHDVIQAVNPYFTPSDIDKGARWNSEISGRLESSKIGIICVTPENLDAPWIMFEAGALSKTASSRVCPILFDVENTDLKGPLVQFQTAYFTKAEILDLTMTINASLDDGALNDTSLKRSFEHWWPTLEKNINALLASKSPKTKRPQRKDRDILNEILEHVRKQSARLSNPKYSRKAMERLIYEWSDIFEELNINKVETKINTRLRDVLIQTLIELDANEEMIFLFSRLLHIKNPHKKPFDLID